MYYYKYVENGDVVNLEQRSLPAVSPPNFMVPITEGEYNTLFEEMEAERLVEKAAALETA